MTIAAWDPNSENTRIINIEDSTKVILISPENPVHQVPLLWVYKKLPSIGNIRILSR